MNTLASLACPGHVLYNSLCVCSFPDRRETLSDPRLPPRRRPLYSSVKGGGFSEMFCVVHHESSQKYAPFEDYSMSCWRPSIHGLQLALGQFAAEFNMSGIRSNTSKSEIMVLSQKKKLVPSRQEESSYKESGVHK